MRAYRCQSVCLLEKMAKATFPAIFLIELLYTQHHCSKTKYQTTKDNPNFQEFSGVIQIPRVLWSYSDYPDLSSAVLLCSFLFFLLPCDGRIQVLSLSGPEWHAVFSPENYAYSKTIKLFAGFLSESAPGLSIPHLRLHE